MTKKKIFLTVWTVVAFAAVLTLFLLLLLPRTQAPVATEPKETTTEATTLPPPTENVFTPMDFGYDGDYLTCLTDESILGIDVARGRGEIDWQ